jgi:hypothetical protein
MEYNVVLTFRDNVVHRLEMGEDLQVAQGVLESIAVSGDTFRFKNKSSDLIYVANLDNLLFAFIEETKNKEDA